MDLSRFEPLLHSRNRLVRSLLAIAECCYRGGYRLSSARTRSRIRRGTWPIKLDVPVMSIGNLVAGGVGKTPLVEAIARAHQAAGGSPGILSRGYRSLGSEGNDEARLLARRLSDIPHVQDKDRIGGGRRLLRDFPNTDLILLDDGLQHRRLHRDVELVVLDATRPFGWGYMLPRGYLREPWRGLSRADAVIVTRRAQASNHKLAILDDFLQTFCGGRPVLAADTIVDGIRGADGKTGHVVSGKRVAAFAGIGNPNAFFRTAARAGFAVVETRSYPDHHHFDSGDIGELTRWASGCAAESLLCTEKDGVKLESLPEFATASVPIEQLCMHLKVDVERILDLVPGRFKVSD